MNRQWTATATPTTPGWTTVPQGLVSHELEAWVGDQHDELRSLWASEWRDEFTSGVRDILTAAAATRSDDVVLDVLCWPFPCPAASRVRVNVGPPSPIESWTEAGFEVDAYHGARMGPGAQCIDTTVLQGTEEQVCFVVAHYLFNDGDRAVQVVVEPTFFEVFARMLPGLHGFIDSLEVRRSGGGPFVAQPVPGLSRVEEEEWKVQASE